MDVDGDAEGRRTRVKQGEARPNDSFALPQIDCTSFNRSLSPILSPLASFPGLSRLSSRTLMEAHAPPRD